MSDEQGPAVVGGRPDRDTYLRFARALTEAVLRREGKAYDYHEEALVVNQSAQGRALVSNASRVNDSIALLAYLQEHLPKDSRVPGLFASMAWDAADGVHAALRVLLSMCRQTYNFPLDEQGLHQMMHRIDLAADDYPPTMAVRVVRAEEHHSLQLVFEHEQDAVVVLDDLLEAGLVVDLASKAPEGPTVTILLCIEDSCPETEGVWYHNERYRLVIRALDAPDTYRTRILDDPDDDWEDVRQLGRTGWQFIAPLSACIDLRSVTAVPTPPSGPPAEES